MDGLVQRLFTLLAMAVIALGACWVAMTFFALPLPVVIAMGLTLFVAMAVIQLYVEIRRDMRLLKNHAVEVAGFENEVSRRIDYLAGLVERNGGAAPDEMARRMRGLSQEFAKLGDRVGRLEARPAPAASAPAVSPQAASPQAQASNDGPSRAPSRSGPPIARAAAGPTAPTTNGADTSAPQSGARPLDALRSTTSRPAGLVVREAADAARETARAVNGASPEPPVGAVRSAGGSIDASTDASAGGAPSSVAPAASLPAASSPATPPVGIRKVIDARSGEAGATINLPRTSRTEVPVPEAPVSETVALNGAGGSAEATRSSLPRVDEVHSTQETSESADTSAEPIAGTGSDETAEASKQPNRYARSRSSDPLTAQELRRALAGDDLVFHLVPILSLPERRPDFYEAVMRLRLSDGQWMESGDLLTLAEKHGLHSLVERKTLYSAARMLRAVKAMGKQMRLFSRLAVASLADERGFRELRTFLEASGDLRDELVLEVTQKRFRGLTSESRQRFGLVAEAGFALSLGNVRDDKVDVETLRRLGFRHARAEVRLLLDEPEPGGAETLAMRLAAHRVALIATGVADEEDVFALIDRDVAHAQGPALSPPRLVKGDLLRGPAPAPLRSARPAAAAP